MEPEKLYSFGYAVDHCESEEFAAANVVLRMPDNRGLIGMAHGRNINRAIAYALRDLANEILREYKECDQPIFAQEIVVK
jgi:hypothetical protein